MSLLDKIRDPYERKARLTPGLLVLLPLLVPIVGLYGPKHPILTGILGLVCGSGALFALSNIVRGYGKRLEQKLIKNWGGLPTTICLRHRNTFFDSLTKNRYHSDINKKLGIQLPSKEQEEQSPLNADDAYIGACRLLREKSRSEKNLLLKENISYGFHRNMLAMKIPGVLICIVVVLYSLISANIISLHRLSFDWMLLDKMTLVELSSLLVSSTLLAAWIFYFRSESVKQAGFTYAERLFECLENLPDRPFLSDNQSNSLI